jgi:hypothetical protein
MEGSLKRQGMTQAKGEKDSRVGRPESLDDKRIAAGIPRSQSLTRNDKTRR